MKNPQEEADKLRKEAKDLLSKQLLAGMNIHNVEADGFYLEVVERIVDCIIGAAVLETSAIMAASMSEVRKAS